MMLYPRILIVLLLLSAFATAGTYMPLEEGNRWSYSGDIVGPDIKEIVSGPNPEIYNSYAVLYDVSDHSLGLKNYWSTNDDGDVFLHGFARMSPRISRFYDPPLKVVDGPLFPGKVWISASTVFEVPGGPAIGYFDVEYTVTEPEIVIIGGEEHEAYGILEARVLPVAGVGSDWTTDGRPFDLAKEGDVVVPHWWVENIGEVRYRSIGIFELIDFFLEGVVTNEDASWSDLKQKYR